MPPLAYWSGSLLFAWLGYLLGSIPVGYIVARQYGIDIREHGSGNIGATNVLRVLGKKPGYFVFACDLLKGLLAACLPILFAVSTPQGETMAKIVCALCCILGHNFPVWLRFRGGKGVATTVGVLLGLMPAAFLVAAVVWVVAFYASRYVSLASLAAAAVLPVSVFFLSRHADPASGGFGPMFWFSVVAAALIFWRHRANISRLLNGTESRFTPKPKKTPENPV